MNLRRNVTLSPFRTPNSPEYRARGEKRGRDAGGRPRERYYLVGANHGGWRIFWFYQAAGPHWKMVSPVIGRPCNISCTLLFSASGMNWIEGALGQQFLNSTLNLRTRWCCWALREVTHWLVLFYLQKLSLWAAFRPRDHDFIIVLDILARGSALDLVGGSFTGYFREGVGLFSGLSTVPRGSALETFTFHEFSLCSSCSPPCPYAETSSIKSIHCQTTIQRDRVRLHDCLCVYEHNSRAEAWRILEISNARWCKQQERTAQATIYMVYIFCHEGSGGRARELVI